MFDRSYLDTDPIRKNRERRDAELVAQGVDLEKFREYMKMSDVGNECDTDEYRETQPNKGLVMIAEFFEGWPGKEAQQQMLDYLVTWLSAVRDGDGSYAGDNELTFALNLLWDYRWEEGFYSLYQPFVNDFTDLDDRVNFFKEDV